MNNQKRKKAAWVLCLLVLAIVSLLCTCAPPADGEAGDDASVTITVGGGSRAAYLPWAQEIDIADLDHTITFSGGPGADVVREGVKAGQTASFTVAPGHWDITVKAYLGELLMAEGSASVDLKPGRNGSVPITMRQAGDITTDPEINAITTVNVVIVAPVNGDTPATTAEGDGNFTVGAVTWSPPDNPFLGGTVYTASVTLTANDGHTFIGLRTATVNGQNATVNNTGSAVTLSHTFAATDTRTVTGIEINTQPTKMTYTHEDKLDLTGLVITLTHDDTTTEDVTASEFNGRNITATPSAGDTLIHSAHNGTPVKIKYGSQHECDTGFLTVNPKVITFTVDAIPAQTYTGGFITPTITVRDGSTVLAHNTDYTVGYANNTDAGTATVTVTGVGNYAGSAGSGTFIINPKTIAGAQIYVTPPVKNATPSKTATGGDANGEGDFTVGAVSWSQSGSPFTGDSFLGGVIYAVSVTLTANTNYTFTGMNPTSATITGQPATVSVSNDGKTATLSYTFSVTDTRTVTSISVISQPDRLSYTHGNTLDLTGLKVRIVFDTLESEEIAAADFLAKGIGANPAHGNNLICAAHDGKPVTIIYGNLTDTTNNLTVAKAAGAAVGTPALEAKTINSITIDAVTPPSNQLVEYGYSLSPNTTPSAWQQELTFSGLNNGTTYYIFARAAGNDNYEAGTPDGYLSVTTLQTVLQDKIVYYWIDKQGILVTTSDGAVTVAAGAVLTITAQGDGYDVKQWHLDGVVETGQSGATYSFSRLEVGSHTVGLFVEKDGRLYNTNITVTVY